MAAWKYAENILGVSCPGAVDATQMAPLGTIRRFYHAPYGEGEFIYLKGVANTAVGTWVTFNMDDGSTARLAANAIGPVGVAMAATVANTFGWYQIEGKAVGSVLASFADNGDIYITATAGSVDDSGTVLVHNARGASAIGTPSANKAEIEIWRPFVLMT